MSVGMYNAIAEWLVFLFFWDIALCLLLLVSLGIFRRTRGIAGGAALVGSWIAGTLVWVGCAMVTWTIWGLPALILGIFLLGIGVFPIALIAAASTGDWSDALGLGGMIVIVLVVRFAAFLMVSKHDRERAVQLA